MTDTHGFKTLSCHDCPRPEICDCPCTTCTFQRHVAAAVATNNTCSYCDTREGVTNQICKDCASPCDYCGAAAGQICKIGCGSYPDEEPEDHYGDYEEPDHEEEEHVQRCSGCRCPMDGDEGWGPSICSRTCYKAVCDGSF